MPTAPGMPPTSRPPFGEGRLGLGPGFVPPVPPIAWVWGLLAAILLGAPAGATYVMLKALSGLVQKCGAWTRGFLVRVLGPLGKTAVPSAIKELCLCGDWFVGGLILRKF